MRQETNVANKCATFIRARFGVRDDFTSVSTIVRLRETKRMTYCKVSPVTKPAILKYLHTVT